MLTLILGPMKSGKSLELIGRTTPHAFTNNQVVYVQPTANVRDQAIASRAGAMMEAFSITSLRQVKMPFDVLAIDEVHMFRSSDTKVMEQWLREGKSLFVSGLDLDYRGKMPLIITKLLELKPEKVIFKRAVCDVCKEYTAHFSQILLDNSPVLSGLPSIVPEDGRYSYQARCRNCFVKK